MSHRLAAAVQMFLRSKGCVPEGIVGQLDSAFFLTWAPHLRELTLGHSCYLTPGIHTFLQACTSLRLLQLDCDSPLQAVQADSLMESCRGFAGALYLDCSDVPYIPLTDLTSLHVDLGSTYAHHSGAKQDQHAALLYRLVHLTRLQTLSLDLGVEMAVNLACPVNLPELRQITVHLILGESASFELGWLSRQPCASLEMRIDILTPSSVAHLALTRGLRTLPLARLTLLLASRTPARVQRLWMDLAVRDMVHIEVREGCCSAEMPLCALPRCPDILLRGRGHRPMHVDWAAMTVKDSGRIHIFCQEDQDLAVLGGCEIPAHLQDQPWQLAVHVARQVHGLDRAQRVDSKLVLHSAAAIAAGWTAEL